ncbi:autophagy protein atg9 [Thoreauomyces humboldtii]|nr:autophagy protein atg9 [Thoreauomyces humboldtii]
MASFSADHAPFPLLHENHPAGQASGENQYSDGGGYVPPSFHNVHGNDSDSDSEDGTPPSFYEGTPDSPEILYNDPPEQPPPSSSAVPAPAQMGQIFVTDWDQQNLQHPHHHGPSPAVQVQDRSQYNYDNFTSGGYEPPVIDFEDHDDEDEDEASENGEAPASIRYEMAPLNRRTYPPEFSSRSGGGRRLPQHVRHGRGSMLGQSRGSALGGFVGNLAASITNAGSLLTDPKSHALRTWTEAENIDKLLEKLYAFFEGKGFYSILLARGTNLFILAFIVGFSTFLFACIDYPLVHQKQLLSEVIRENCVSEIHGFPKFILALFLIWWSWQCLRLVIDIPALLEISRFYQHVLGFGETEVQTIAWTDVTAKLTGLPIRRGPLNAHTIANRILRKENYMIALFNKDVLNLMVPYFGRHQHLTKVMEWNLQFCILGYVFGDSGKVGKKFVSSGDRTKLIEGLRKRFILMAAVNLICAPFILSLLIMHFFFRYTEEFHKNPSSLGTRQYSPFARWKFREFNELPHLFQKRLNRSYRLANKYMNQFPNSKITTLARFASFVTGSFLSVLVVATALSEDLLHGFEITPARSVFFYIGIFATVTAVLRGMVPDDNEVFEPALLLRNVVEEVRYLPEGWKNKMHTDEVRQQFAALLPYRLLLFIQEIMSVIFAPIILFHSLPSCAGEIIDFFKEFTIHVDGVGYVCSFAVWDFRKCGNAKYGVPTQADNEQFVSKGGKMEQSFVNFKINNPDWDPGEEGSMYLNAILARAGNDPAQHHHQQQQQQQHHQGSGVGAGYHPALSPTDPGNSSSLLIHSLLRPKRGNGIDTHASRTSPPRLHGQFHAANAHHPHHPQHLQPESRPPHPLSFDTSHAAGGPTADATTAGGASGARPRTTSTGDSMMLGASSLTFPVDERGEVSRTLFALLERIYEDNQTMY